jgi:conserved domain protein
MKNKIILLMLLFVFTYTKAQTVVYTYNAQGSCTSRVIRGTLPKAKKAPKVSIDTKRLKVDLSPSPTFQNQLSISVMGLPSGHNLSYIMANVSGQVAFNGLIGNGSITLTTTNLPKGIYIVKVSGEDFEKSYKLLKN